MRTPDPDRIAEIYRRITESGRDEVFITLRGAADVDADYRATLAAGGPLAGLVQGIRRRGATHHSHKLIAALVGVGDRLAGVGDGVR